MRVISGSARSVPLKTVPDLETRPILDRIKKSLFSILDAAGLIGESRVLDLYAGAGTLGIEALSRGAAYGLFVERRPEAIKLLHENLAKTRLAARAEVRQGEVSRYLEGQATATNLQPQKQPFHLIFFDPPFAFSGEQGTREALEAEMAGAGALLAPEGRLILRTERKTEAPSPRGLILARTWADGPHAIYFDSPQGA